MSKIKTYKGQLPIGEQEKIHLSTRDGLTGYKINKFEIMPSEFNVGIKLVGKIFLTDQTGSITATVDFNDSDILAAAYYEDAGGSSGSGNPNKVIFDKETFNQDIFVYITDAINAITKAATSKINNEIFKSEKAAPVIGQHTKQISEEFSL